MRNRLSMDLPTRPGLRYHRIQPHPSTAWRVDNPGSFGKHVRKLAGAERLDSLRPGLRITIAFTDSTRHSPDHLMVGWLARHVTEQGLADKDITLLCATGLHRPMTHDERVAKLGADLVERFTIIDHNAMDTEGLIDLGEVNGIPVVVNRACVECDLLLATGVVEAHQYAGYSGGAKTIVIGCGGERTIEGTHGVAMIDRAGVTIGSVARNPFQDFIRDAGERIGIDAVVNVLLDENGEIIDGAVGSPIAVHDDLTKRAASTCEAAVDRPMGLAIIGVPEGKDANIYQASRAATYAALVDPSPLIEGAPIVLLADVPEGVGAGVGEKRFGELLAGDESLDTLLDRLRGGGFPAGGQRAYIVARVLKEHPIIIVGRGDRDAIESCRMIPATDLEEGIDIVIDLLYARGAESAVDAMVLDNGMTVVRTPTSPFPTESHSSEL